jgi:hypothetical protein
LKLSREIESPAKRAAPASPAVATPAAAPGPAQLTPLPGVKIAAPTQRAPGAPQAKGDDDDRGAIFLRADRIDGEANERVEASGKVELRARRETVLADWLQYDLIEDEIWGKGNVTLRRGIDTISGPEMKFQRDTETGYFKSPRYAIGESGAHGEARRDSFSGSQQFRSQRRDLHDVRCAESRLVSHRSTKSRSTACARSHRAQRPRVLSRHASAGDAVAGVSADQRAQVRIPHAHRRLIADPRLRIRHALLFNLAPNYDATFTPR